MTTILLKAGYLGMALVTGALLTAQAAWAGNEPYTVRGNEHIIVGITLDAAAVRAALPDGLEPAEGVTGGLNVYYSDGGEGIAAYQRTYVWVDLANYDSLTGNKGRYILWVSDGVHVQKLAGLGYDAVPGKTTLTQNGEAVTGTTTVEGKQVMEVSIKLAGGECGDIMGTMNYPSMPKDANGMMFTQYGFIGKGCGAKPLAVDIMAPEDHPLSKFRPTTLVWAAFARDLSFSASPLLPIKTAAQ